MAATLEALELRQGKVLSADHTAALKTSLDKVQGVLADHAKSKKKEKKKPNLKPAPDEPQPHNTLPLPANGGPSSKKRGLSPVARPTPISDSLLGNRRPPRYRSADFDRMVEARRGLRGTKERVWSRQLRP